MSNLQPSLKWGKYGNGERRNQSEPIGELPSGIILESGGPENAISQLTIDVKIVRKLITIRFSVSVLNRVIMQKICIIAHRHTYQLRVLECQILKIQDFVWKIFKVGFSPLIGESGFSSKVGATAPKSG